MKAIKFKAGEHARFVPKFGTYDMGDARRRNYIVEILDESDIPRIKFISTKRQMNYGRITAALQEDLVAL